MDQKPLTQWGTYGAIFHVAPDIPEDAELMIVMMPCKPCGAKNYYIFAKEEHPCNSVLSLKT
jgi:hypothetical protein